MSRSSSLVRRFAQGSALAASAAALLAAFATSALASYLIQRGEDRRLADAAVIFAAELDEDGTDLDAVREVYRDESEEMDHTGMLFAVYDTAGRLLVGDRRIALPNEAGCESARGATLRTCRAPSKRGLIAVVGAAHFVLFPILAGASVLSALFAAALAWVTSRPISRFIAAPLIRLRERIDELDPDAISATHLGSPDGVLEVDALRHTLRELVFRMERALALAHRFAANAAHELRTPLTAVRAELELLAENIDDVALRADAARVKRKLGELSVLVERLLILSEPARAKTDLYEVVSLSDLLEDTIGALPEGERHRAFISEGDALVHGDAALLATMISNAIANGLKFGDRVSTEVTISDREVVLFVDDDGPGVGEGDPERLFEPFFRSNDAIRRRLPGHGLGLALIRHIARTHGGDARFVDKREGGTRLEIRLPVADDPARPLARPSGADPS